MNRKIELAKKKRTQKAQEQALVKSSVDTQVELKNAINRLYELLNDQEQYDFDRLHAQLVQIDKRLDLAPHFKSLEKSIKTHDSTSQLVHKTKIDGFSELLKAVKENKQVPVDLKALEKTVVNIEQYIREQTQPSDQGAENYQPVRRVVKVGNRFMFDDTPTYAGGGGGNSSGGGSGGNTTVDNFPTEYPLPNAQVTTLTPQTDALTDTELRATPVGVDTGLTQPTTPSDTQPVSASSLPLPTGASTSAKQDTIIGHVDGIEGAVDQIEGYVDGIETLLTTIDGDTGNISTKIDTVAGAVSGSEMQVDVVGSLPAGTNAIGKLSANSGVDIGDVDVTSSVATAFATGSNLDIDTTAEQLVSASVACKFGVTVKAATTNTGTVYIGASSSVTAGTNDSTDGFPLEPGESVTIPVNNINLLYGIASVVNQKVFLMAV